MTDSWSLDARALVRPARTFQALATTQRGRDVRSTFWTAARRPLFLCLVIGCVISLLGTSVATMRFIGASAMYWSFVPLIEILGLAIVVWRRRGSRRFASLIDAFFAGHAAWTIFLLLLGAVMAVAPPQYWWFLLTRPAMAGLVAVTGWSAYVDLCFFRYVCGAPLASAIRSTLLNRVIVWILVFWIVAVPEPTPFGVIQEIVEAIVELLK